MLACTFLQFPFVSSQKNRKLGAVLRDTANELQGKPSGWGCCCCCWSWWVRGPMGRFFGSGDPPSTFTCHSCYWDTGGWSIPKMHMGYATCLDAFGRVALVDPWLEIHGLEVAQTSSIDVLQVPKQVCSLSETIWNQDSISRIIVGRQSFPLHIATLQVPALPDSFSYIMFSCDFWLSV